MYMDALECILVGKLQSEKRIGGTRERRETVMGEPSCREVCVTHVPTTGRCFNEKIHM